jgi:DinB family protein
MWGKYMATIIAEDRPTIRAMNPRTWIKRTNYPDLEFALSFRAFNKQRAELLALLRPLPEAAWSRRALVTGAGRPRERTVFEYAQWLANHERTHVSQIARIVSGSTRRTA